jgi:ABC-type bacteriocin/lantibiotic exporter with double-glycine peptidase domain
MYKSLAAIRQICGADTTGANLMGLVVAAKRPGFKANPLKGNVSDETLSAKLIFPFIAHLKIPAGSFFSDHFVVIKKIAKRTVEIWDPSPSKGIVKLHIEWESGNRRRFKCNYI